MRILSVVSCLLLVVSLVGCGERTESASYYYSPSWTRGGSIIFIYGLNSVRKDALGTQLGSSYTETVSTAEPTATAAVNTLFDATDATPYSMSTSPVGDYVAYLNNLDGSTQLFSKIVIRNIAAGAHTGLDIMELAFSPGIKSFDWSNSGQKLVYCTSTQVRTVNLSGTMEDVAVISDSNIEFVAWKYGNRIAYVRTSGSDKILTLVNSDGTGKTPLAASASVDKPQISSQNTSEVYGIAGGAYCKVNIDAGTPATAEVLAGFKGDLPRLSPNADKVIYGKTGESSGIYLIDLTVTPTAETKIK